MRLVSTFAALALSAATLPLVGVSLIERQDPHDVELTHLIAQPQAYQGMRVAFRATFVQTAGLFDPFHTQFTPERSLNVVVWDDQARIWEPEVRSQPLVTLYFDKTRDGAQELSSLDKYTIIEVIGEVVSDFRGQPWINCHQITPLPSVGAFSDNAVYHLEQANALADDGSHALANEDFAAALDERLPLYAQASIYQMQGRNLMDARRFVHAAEILEEAIELLDRNREIDRDLLPQLHYLRAKALSEVGEDRMSDGESAQEIFVQAVEHARTSVRLDPRVGDAYAVLGISLAGLERWEEAKRQCARAIRMLPDNAEIRWYLGRIQDSQGAHEAAIATLKKGIDLAPKDYRLHKAIASAYFNRHKQGGPTASQDLITALREYDIAIRLNAQDPDLHFASGNVIARAADLGAKVRIGSQMVEATYEMAKQRWRDCLAVDETYWQAHLALGRRLRTEEQHDQAVEHLKRALELQPEREQLYTELGNYLWELQRRSEAYDVFAAYQKISPEHIDTLYALGRLSLEMQQWEQGILWHEQVIDLAPKHAMAHADQTEMKFEAGRYDEVLEHAQEALALLEDEAQIVRVKRFKGLAHWQLEEIEEAIAALDGNVIGSTDIRLHLSLGWALSMRPDQGSRIEALARAALEVESESSAAKELLGWGLYLAGDYAAAVANLKAAEIDDPARAGYRLGMALFQQGPEHYAEAQPLLEQGADLRSRKPHLEYAYRKAREALEVIEDWVEAQEEAARAAAREES